MCPYWCREGADAVAEDHEVTTAERHDNKTVAREASAHETTHGGLLVDALLTHEDPAAVDGETRMAFEAGRLCFGTPHLPTFLQGTHYVMTCVNSELCPGADEVSSACGNPDIMSTSIDNQRQLLEECPEVQQVYSAADCTVSHYSTHLNGSVMLR